MGKAEDIFLSRNSLDEICSIPEKIISVYSLEQHIWADANSEDARRKRLPETQTVKEFQIGPVRAFLNDILRNMAAPYKPEKKDNPIGQGYWIQAEFGSGKSHLLSFIATLALGSQEVWQLIKEKETHSGQGKRESLYRFWEEGLKSKSTGTNKGIFVVARTLVGSGGGAVGLNDKGKRLSEYILESIKEQLLIETGKNLSLYPAEVLADRFLGQDLERYRKDLKKFLKDPNYFAEDEYEDAEEFIKSIQQNKSPEYKRSAGNKLWRFYNEYLKVQPQVPAETEDILKHVVDTIMAEGYTGVLLILDEISLFMKDRDEDQRVDDEKTLVVLSNRLAKVHNLPIWTVCAAQQAIEAKPGMGVKNIIADDRLKQVPLLEKDTDYYDIVLSRVRKIEHPEYINNYYLHYSNQFTWPKTIGSEEFAHFFPFHKPALEVLRDITHELTTARSAIHFMHQTLKHQIKVKGKELIRLWELFDETMEYEEDPSGTYAGLVAIKTKKETEYQSYLTCRSQIDGLTRGALKVYRDRSVRIIQTLFLYYIAHNKMQGLNAEQIANSVMIERQPDATPEENIQHYESLSEALKTELPQIVESFDDAKTPHYRFEPVIVGIDPNREFQKARDEAEGNEAIQNSARERLLALNEWAVKSRLMTIDLVGDNKSIFNDIAPYPPANPNIKTMEINWQGRQTFGIVTMRDFANMVANSQVIPTISSDQDDQDFAVYIASKPVSLKTLTDLQKGIKDRRVLLWTPDELNHDEKQRLLDIAAYWKLVNEWGGKDTEDAVAIINWVANRLKTEMGKIVQIIRVSYGRGRIDAIDNTNMKINSAGTLEAILTPLIERALSGVYESRDIKFEHPFIFKKEDAVKIINGIVKSGKIPRNAKPGQNISAVQNFGSGLKIIKPTAEKELDFSHNAHVKDIWDFIDTHLKDHTQTMSIDTIYKNFMGIGGPKDYGLTRRMVQIYLLCLVQSGKIQIHLTGKSGLTFSILDYSNIEGTEFAAKVLDAMDVIQKVAKPENWEVLRPYAEKILNEPLPITHDDAQIAKYRTQLKELFNEQKDIASRVQAQAQSLFALLENTNPYDSEVDQAAKFFGEDVSSGKDIELILFALKQHFGYQAFDSGRADDNEVNDLAVRLQHYKDISQLVQYSSELRTGYIYCLEPLPDIKALENIRNTQEAVAQKLKELQPYIDSAVKLKTDLIGSNAPDKAEANTINALLQDYSLAYIALHDHITEQCSLAYNEITELTAGPEWDALLILEEITALQPAFCSHLKEQLQGMASGIFYCSDPSKKSIQKDLETGTHHNCQLSFANAWAFMGQANLAKTEAIDCFEKTLNEKFKVLLHPAIIERLEQGRKEPIIKKLLACNSPSEVRSILIKDVSADPGIVEIINRYLKRIVIKKVFIKDFEPEYRTIEIDQIDSLGTQFQDFLNKHLSELIDELKKDGLEDDTLPMLVLE